MKAKVVITRGTDGRYEANMEYYEQLNFGLFGEGNTVEETIADFHICANEMKSLYTEEGKKFPKLDFDFEYDVASFLQYYLDTLSLAGIGRLTGINRKQLSHYLTGKSQPSVKTIKKIEEALQKFGKELSHINLV